MADTITVEDLEFDRQHIWHPYTSITNCYEMYPVTSADGVRLTLADGRQLIDGMASWWSAIHGYNHSGLNEALQQQLGKMAHVMFGGITHQPAIRLARQLLAVTPESLQQVFFADSGSVSVEVAIKMAIQYWVAAGKPAKKRLLTVKKGYHGDTFAPMSVCDPEGMHEVFAGVLLNNVFVEAPQCGFHEDWQEDYIAEFKAALDKHHQEIAAVILEPIVQNAGGMRFYSPIYLKRIRELCDDYQVLLILDEIATGFGRTGKLFACEYADISPDIMCVGKALTGGYMTLAATLCTQQVAHTISNQGVLMHGPTFMANPLACSVASASLELLQAGHWKAQVEQLSITMEACLAPCRELANVADVRVLGAIGVVELKQSVDMKTIQPLFVNEGVWVRPFGKLIYIMPPYVMEQEDCQLLCKAIYQVITKIKN
ncbi:adenosylmethionine--8-amino-7-oxononanoate transaminase [Spartinivicinus poritis]|uniref:Adenosylmethionine-8-amino-7-oxononanoate aminotransferase n=1 Tax=Spartinivicinus poritis TaxID=2994640 RepID=A0ABT5U8Z7_9GAMM|nr:adenosylmethionine--8-amino-7-oxononanoate transaminase [Spartinivicinus sp. A2-2]MDE1462849.1 adenosylmethionine--8-amino-7-oxononanoate transaminase [Spartinivicinus sp. A2-2]